ncbi:MAG TPA: 2Fe-2S iron-sulfur cluster-binding protein [Bacteriovoracaceae bacterium]|nr:2Fe-2S iron-sulfur cluster-binding protein [Bacteriovoracaceae bacterium]
MPTVSIKGTAKSYVIKEGGVMYDSLHDQGEELPHGCLSGSCGACKVEVISGAENLSVPGAIEQNTIDAVKNELTEKQKLEITNPIRLSCRARVQGDCTIKPFA